MWRKCFFFFFSQSVHHHTQISHHHCGEAETVNIITRCETSSFICTGWPESWAPDKHISCWGSRNSTTHFTEVTSYGLLWDVCVSCVRCHHMHMVLIMKQLWRVWSHINQQHLADRRYKSKNILGSWWWHWYHLGGIKKKRNAISLHVSDGV